MKKLFTSKQDSQFDSFIGKHYAVGDLTLLVEDVIAEGGFSFVFLVRDTMKNRTYALKRMLVNSQTDLENCKQEIGIMKAFHRHPAMVSFKGHHTKHIGNGIYEVLLLMQHCPNGTVVDLMNQNLSAGFCESLVREIFTGIVDAVALMHHNSYSHRDLKVENILIGPNNEFVLCDFGSAFKGTLDPEVHGHNFVEENINKFTTLAYRAPEMCDLYLGYKVGPAADLWALGVLLYKLCFFTTPFEENTLAIARARYTVPDPDKYSDKLLSVIRDTLKVNPAERLTAKQILTRLKDEDASCGGVRGPGPAKEVSPHRAPSSNKPPQLTPTVPTHLNHSHRVQPQSEESLAIKSRSRPRGHKQPIENILIPPPDNTITPTRDSVMTSRDNPMVPRDSVLTSRDNPMVPRDSVLTSRDNPMVPRDSVLTSRDNPMVPRDSVLTSRDNPMAPRDSVMTSRDNAIAPRDSVMTSRDNAMAPRDSVITSRDNAMAPRDDHMATAPANATEEVKLKRNSVNNSPQQPTTDDPWGKLSATSTSSPTNFDACGWSNNPFEPTPAEDEFLKLSLRDKGSSQTRLDEIPGEITESKPAKSTKVSRAQTRRADRDPLSSREPLSSHNRHRAFSNEAIVPLSRTLSLSSDQEPVSPRALNHGMSLTSLTSLDSKSSSAKKKKKLHLFGRKKVLSQEDFVAKHSNTYDKSVVGNPLYDDLNT